MPILPLPPDPPDFHSYKYALGTEVVCGSASPVMAIHKRNPDRRSPGMVECKWYDPKKGKFLTEVFMEEALSPAPPAPPKPEKHITGVKGRRR